MFTSTSRSIVRTAAKVYLAPLIALGWLMLVVLILAVLAVATQLGDLLLRHFAL